MDVNDKIFDFAYMMAFRDATMRKAFPKREDEEADDFRVRKNKIKDYLKPTVQNYIDAIMNSDKQERPDPFVVIKSICDLENIEQEGFTFGNAQKLVNMTAKYMFLSAYGDPVKRAKFESCHCPMDSVMMNRLQEKHGEYNLKWEPFKKKWSRLEIKDDESLAEYNRFQSYIGKIAKQLDIYPLEVDFKLWDE